MPMTPPRLLRRRPGQPDDYALANTGIAIDKPAYLGAHQRLLFILRQPCTRSRIAIEATGRLRTTRFYDMIYAIS